MTPSAISTLVLIGIVAVASPVLAELTGRLAVPGVVFELGLGIVIGPAVLGVAHPASVIVALKDMGLSYLMFLALAVAVLLDRRNPEVTSALLFAFVFVAVAAALAAARPHPPKVIRLLHRHVNSSAQLPIRISVLLIASLVLLAFELGLDVLLGAFAAGIVVRLLVRGEDTAVVRGKLEAIGFGFLVPIFFVVSGMQLDLHALFATPTALLRVPLFLALLLVVRGTPALLLYRRDLPRRELVPLALCSATGLPLIVVITTIGVGEGSLRPVNAAALVAAGVLSVLLYPTLARKRLGISRPAASGPAMSGPAMSRPAMSRPALPP
jgi:Kef-type K+ transport system membrane component KefB